jgi:rhodanese-related sulfurtransferase
VRTITQILAASITLAVATPAFAQAPSIHDSIFRESDQKTQQISTSELHKILVSGGATLLDTRTRAEFDAGHIAGANSLDAEPSAQIGAVERLVNGDKTRALVLYCNGPYCQASRRLADQLTDAGFTNVRRYQLGIPVWRALGGPTAIELDGIIRARADKTAVFIDVRPSDDFGKGSVKGAVNAPVADVVAGKKMPLPEDDFNRRIVLFGADGAQAREIADILSKRPWHNVAYFPGSFAKLSATLKDE